ncbi:hypothetical protein, partial [Angelakisella massiliensis]|uniref:hypothetical protein n=1 Tax=Angelakisella massiliensis TaxID=1871018 RepID=UPI0024B26662
ALPRLPRGVQLVIAIFDLFFFHKNICKIYPDYRKNRFQGKTKFTIIDPRPPECETGGITAGFVSNQAVYPGGLSPSGSVLNFCGTLKNISFKADGSVFKRSF